MMQLSGEIEEAAIIQDIPWHKRMLNIIIPIQKSSIMSGYLLPFITCARAVPVLLFCYAGLYPLHDAGLLRRDGSVCVFQRHQPDFDCVHSDLQRAD